MTKGEHTNERTNVRTYVLTYIRTGQTLYPLHNFVVRGDNNNACFLDFRAQKFPLIFLNVNPFKHQQAMHFGVLNYEKQHKEAPVKFWEDLLYFQHFMLLLTLPQISDYHHLKDIVLMCVYM